MHRLKRLLSIIARRLKASPTRPPTTSGSAADEATDRLMVGLEDASALERARRLAGTEH